MMMTSFKRADESAGNGQIMVTRMTGTPGQGAKKMVTIGDPNAPDGTVVVINAGFIVAPSPTGLQVMMVMPEASENISGEMLKTGDKIISVNDIVDQDIHAFQDAWEKVPIGANVTVVFERDEVRHEATFVKSQPEPGTRVIHQSTTE